MNIQELILLVLAGIIIFIVASLILFYHKFKHRIRSFLKPELYAIITMLEQDNNVRTWLQPKSSDLSFTFNNGTYDMYDTVLDKKLNTSVPVFKKVPSAIYKTGAISQFFYNENNSSPIDFRLIKSTTNPQITHQRKQVEISNMFQHSPSGLIEFLQQYGVIIALILIVLLFIFLATSSGGAT